MAETGAATPSLTRVICGSWSHVLEWESGEVKVGNYFLSLLWYSTWRNTYKSQFTSLSGKLLYLFKGIKCMLFWRNISTYSLYHGLICFITTRNHIPFSFLNFLTYLLPPSAAADWLFVGSGIPYLLWELHALWLQSGCGQLSCWGKTHTHTMDYQLGKVGICPGTLDPPRAPKVPDSLCQVTFINFINYICKGI